MGNNVKRAGIHGRGETEENVVPKIDEIFIISLLLILWDHIAFFSTFCYLLKYFPVSEVEETIGPTDLAYCHPE